MVHSSQQRLAYDGYQLQVYHWQTDPIRDRLLLISHGLGENALRYGHVAAYFAEAGYHVVAFDHQGHGASGGARGRVRSVSSIVGETAAVLNAVDGPQYRHRVLWAHSMGGVLALEALRNESFADRLSAAIVTSPGLIPGSHPGSVLRAAAGVLAKALPDVAIANGLELGDLSRDPTVAERYAADPLNHDRLSFRLGQVFLSLPQNLLEAPTAPEHTPMLLMHGDADGICDVTGSRRYVAANPDAPIVYREWPGYYHELHNEPEWREVLDVARAFLEERLR